MGTGPIYEDPVVSSDKHDHYPNFGDMAMGIAPSPEFRGVSTDTGVKMVVHSFT